MKLRMSILTTVFIIASTIASFAQSSVKTVNLQQTKGEFTVKSLTLSEGDYIFNISNHEIEGDVGFVLAPAGMTEAKDHIKEAYVTAPVAKNKTQKTNVVSLKKGEYVYFCPLNPTPQYTLTVK